MRRIAAVLGVVALSTFATGGTAHAGGVLANGATAARPEALAVRAAVARTPFGSVRWSEMTVGSPAGTSAVLWLVPVRPGAAVDWAPDGWLAALDDATAVRVLPPDEPSACAVLPPPAPVREAARARRFPSAIGLHASEAALREHAGRRGFAIPPDVSARIEALYARGSALLGLELDAAGGAMSPTIRVSDDGPADLPFALTGGAAAATQLTVFAVASQPVTIRGARSIDPGALAFGDPVRDYGSWRATALVQAPWVREASSRDALLEGTLLPTGVFVAPVMQTYFGAAPGGRRVACERAATAAAARGGEVGRICAAGAVARVEGGPGCTPAPGAIDPAAFVCEGADDLALALAGTAPSRAVVTRVAGRIAPGALGADEPLVAAAALSPVVRAGTWGPGPAGASPTPLAPPERARPPITPTRPGAAEPPPPPPGESCGGSSEEAYFASEGCSLLVAAASDDSGTDSDSDSDTDSEDDSEGTEDGWDSDDDDDGDGETAIRTRAGGSRHALGGRPRSSPVSRAALLIGAILLPLRRRRGAVGDPGGRIV